MEKYANLVEIESIVAKKCCQTHIFLQNFVLLQPRTSPPKICKILLTLTPNQERGARRARSRRADLAARELRRRGGGSRRTRVSAERLGAGRQAATLLAGIDRSKPVEIRVRTNTQMMFFPKHHYF